METLVQDIRYGVRMLLKSPGFAAVMVLSLALGVGANTAIFTLVDNILLRMLPVEDPQRLFLLTEPAASGVSIGSGTGTRSLLSYPEYLELRDRNQVFSGIFAAESSVQSINIIQSDATSGREAEPVRCKLVTGGYFSVLGVNAVLGRTFTPNDDQGLGASPLAVISYGYWKRRFSLDPGIVGRSFQLHKTIFTIVGVMPQGFFGENVGQAPDFWVPMVMQGQVMPGRDYLSERVTKFEQVLWLQVMGRLKPDVTPTQAQSNINVLFQQILQTRAGSDLKPEERRELLDQRLELREGSKGASILRGQSSSPLLLLMALVGLVLLITCANVANLLLARASGREREISIRLALGANRLRLIRQLMTDSLLLALLGGGLGLLMAWWGAELLRQLLSPTALPLPIDVAPNTRVLGFTALVSLLTGVIFGLAPALRASRVDLHSALKQSGRSTVSTTRRRFGMPLGKVLVVVQVAMSMVLLIGAGLFVRSLQKLAAIQLGYDADHLLMVRLDPISSGYKGATALSLDEQLLGRLAILPGVRAVSLSDNGLFGGHESADDISIMGYTPKSGQEMNAHFDLAGPNYFSTVGIPVVLGREFEPRDAGNAPMVGVINETMARYYFGSENPIGKMITDEYPDNRFSFRVVGVVKDAKYRSLREQTPRRFYLPYFHPPVDSWIGAVFFEVRTFADPGAVASSVRREILSADQTLQITSLKTMNELVEQSAHPDRVIAQLSSFFGGLALLLACIGLYGVMSYAVSRRTAEMGVRMALGARDRTVLWMVLRETLLLVLLGLTIGLPAALGASRLVSSQLFGVGSMDAIATAGATVVMLVVAATAGYLPARRAASVDPMVALRYE